MSSSSSSSGKTRRLFTVDFCSLKDFEAAVKSTTPSGAALKAARRLFKLNRKANSLSITLKEVGKNGKEKVFKYTVTRTKLDTPKVFTRGGITFTEYEELKVKAEK
jgi:hypothetical protein